MRLVTFLRLGEPRLGAVAGAQVIDLNAAYQHMQESAGAPRARELAAAVLPPDMLGFLAGGDQALAAAREVVARITSVDSATLTAKGIIYPLQRDTVRIEISGLGALENPVMAA